MRNVQSAIAGAVLRRAGSVSTFSGGICGKCSRDFSAYCTFVETKIDSGGSNRARRAYVSCSSDCASNSSRNCFGFSSEERGRSRVPAPPARITAARVVLLIGFSL
jgi:hypothetical protein